VDRKLVDSGRLELPRLAVAYLASVLTAYTLASVCQSLFVLAGLAHAGANMPRGLWLHTIWYDFTHLAFGGKYVSYGMTIMEGFAIALPVAAVIHKYSGWNRLLLYSLAGATAIAVILYALQIRFLGLALITGSRGTAGVACQLLAGALGGAVFAVLSKRTTS
jgi:hypothetical protein